MLCDALARVATMNMLLLFTIHATAQDATSKQRELETAEKEARAALTGFYDAFNKADNDALQRYCSYPHAFVGKGGRIQVVNDRWEMDFERLRQREDWHHSSLDEARAFLVKPTKVHFELTFSRHNTEGVRYSTVSGLWIMTKQQGQWGLSLRSY